MLLCILDHPTQYDPPLWRALTQQGRQRPLVWYLQASTPIDPEIDRQVHWSRAENVFEQRHVPLTSVRESFLALKPRPSAVLVSGWRRAATWRVAPIARALRIPVIVCSDKTLNEPTPGGASGLVYTAFHALKARLFDAFLTTGSLGTEYLASIGCPRPRITTGLYPIDIAYWQKCKREFREKSLALRDGASFVVLAVCKLSARESPLHLLEAFAQVRRSLPGARLIQVGDGPLRAAFEEKVNELNLRAYVERAGYIPYDELGAYYGAADVFTHTPAREPWGISVLEAMACGLPVVASTTVGSAADLVIHGRTGALTYPDDVGSISSALELVARKHADMGARALESVAQFDVGTVADSLASFIESLPKLSPKRVRIASVLSNDIRNQFGRWSS